MEVLRKDIEADEDGGFRVEAGVTYEMTYTEGTTTMTRVTFLAPFMPTEES